MNYVEKYSKEYNLDPYFVMAVMKAESNFDEDAKSNKILQEGLCKLPPLLENG